MNPARCLTIAIIAASCIGCGDDSPTSPAVAPSIDRLFIFATNWPTEEADVPGGACSTVNGQRLCNPTTNDYQLVMPVESGGKVRVQRYTRLGSSTAAPAARTGGLRIQVGSGA